MGVSESKSKSTATKAPLTVDETKIMQEQSDLFDRFYQHPTAENLAKIRKNDLLYMRSSMDYRYPLYLLAIYDTWNLGNFTSKDVDVFRRTIDYLMAPTTILSAGDLDSLWTLFYATGDKKYTKRILDVATGRVLGEPFTDMAATWSYSSHQKRGLLPNFNEEEIKMINGEI